MICEKCGKEMGTNNYCTYCGNELTDNINVRGLNRDINSLLGDWYKGHKVYD